jgi:hypothetical protein
VLQRYWALSFPDQIFFIVRQAITEAFQANAEKLHLILVEALFRETLELDTSQSFDVSTFSRSILLLSPPWPE